MDYFFFFLAFLAAAAFLSWAAFSARACDGVKPRAKVSIRLKSSLRSISPCPKYLLPTFAALAKFLFKIISLILIYVCIFGNPDPWAYVAWQVLRNKPVCPAPYPICRKKEGTPAETTDAPKEVTSSGENGVTSCKTNLWLTLNASLNYRSHSSLGGKIKQGQSTTMSEDIYKPASITELFVDEVHVPKYVTKYDVQNLDVDYVLDNCSHLSEFGKQPDIFTPEKEAYRVAVYSIVKYALGARFHDWVHDRLKDVPGYDFQVVQDDLIMSERIISGPFTVESMNESTLDVFCKTCSIAPGDESPINLQPESFIKTEATGFYDVKILANGGVKRGAPNYDDLYRKWQQEYDHVSVVGRKTIYVYKETHWTEQHHSWIKAFVDNHMKPALMTQRKEFMELVSIKNLKDGEWMDDTTEGVINLQNGVYNIDKDELVPHSKDFGFMYVLPYSYEPEAKCPLFDKFLDDITCGKQDVARVLVEFMGYALAGGFPYAEKALMLYGGGSNGKSTFLEILKSLAGKDNYSALSLTDLGKEQHRQMAEGALLNVGEETNVRALGDSEVFKTMVTGGEVTIRPNYVDPYRVVNKTKLIMACNELPKSSDRSDGLYRRMILVPFKAKFTEESKDPEIRGKLLAELPGIFNLALAGYKTLKKNKWRFSKSEALDAALEDYKDENDFILSWAKDNFELTDNHEDIIFRSTLYSEYRTACIDSGVKSVNAGTVFRHLVASLGYQSDDRKKPMGYGSGKRERYYKYLRRT